MNRLIASFARNTVFANIVLFIVLLAGVIAAGSVLSVVVLVPLVYFAGHGLSAPLTPPAVDEPMPPSAIAMAMPPKASPLQVASSTDGMVANPVPL